MFAQLVTERLRLRPFVETDFDGFAKMHGDPTLKANTHAKPLNRLEARDLFDGYMAAYKRNGFGMMNIRKKEGDADAGECGLWYRDDIGGYTLRYTVRKEHWNQGFSIEAVRAVLTDAIQDKGLDVVHAIAMHHNVRSLRVLEKAGFSKVSDDFRGVKGFIRLELSRAEWFADGALPPAREV